MTDTTTDSGNLPAEGQFFQRGNYAPVPDELTEYALPVEGGGPARTRRLVFAQRAEPTGGQQPLVHR